MQKGFPGSFPKKLETIDTGQLFAELDDTVQMDILGVSHEEWTFMRSQKAVQDIL